MRRRSLLGLVAAALLAACGDPSPRLPTVPSALPGRSVAPGTACTSADLGVLEAALPTVYPSKAQREAKQLLTRVRTRCPDKHAVLDLVQQTLDWRAADAALVTADDARLWAYFRGLFDYIGFGLDNDAGALGAQGFIGVCTSGTGCDLIAPQKTSGVRLHPGALGGPKTDRYLVSGAPTSCAGIDEFTDLQLFGQCIELSVDPKPGDSFPLSTPTSGPAPAIVQTCLSETSVRSARYLTEETLDLGDANTTRPRVAQRSGSQQAVRLRPRPPSSFFVASCDLATDVAFGPPRQPSGPATLLAQASLRLVGSAAQRLLLPRLAHAGHGGLGSLSAFVDEFSKFGPADPFAFQATFDNRYPSAKVPNVVRSPDSPGQPPRDDDLGRTTWTYDAEPPGFVAVRAAPFGSFTTGQLVEVNQAGGASEGKRGVTLLANLAHFEQGSEGSGVRASAGKYRVRWTSMIASPRIGGESPFVLRAVRSTGPTTADTVVIARFSYQSGRTAKSGPIGFAGQTDGGAVPGLAWEQNVRQRFEILVDLGGTTATGGRAYLRTVGLTNGIPSGILSTRTFQAGVRLVQAGWLLRGQDNQIIGMDDFEIVRLPDSYAIQ